MLVLALFGVITQASMLEFWLEVWLVPSLKIVNKSMSIIVLMVGLILVTGGALCRQVAMATCGSNFHHKIQQRQRRSHVLVQKGM
jgi:protein-S-isoprenylcysteine O-methyltransferase Ste14